MFSVLLRLIHFLDFQQVAHTTVLKVHKKRQKRVAFSHHFSGGFLEHFLCYIAFISYACVVESSF